MNGNTSPTGQASTFQPLVVLLERELTVAGIEYARRETSSLREFTRYYLDVVQLLEGYVAGSNEHRPVSRAEVELMCRCALSARSLGEAIQLCARYLELIDPRGGKIQLQVAGDTASFFLDSQRGETSTVSSLVDVTGLFAFCQLFQWLVGRELPLKQVGIGPIQRDDVLVFLRLFKAPVLAGGDSYILALGRDALAWPVVRTPGEFPRFFESFPCGVFEMTANQLPQQVSALLYAAAREGSGLPTQQQVAESLGVPLSTFRRRLSRTGGSFRQLREACLRDVAQELLMRDDMAIKEIAARLGFSDAAAFRRGFLTWTGTSPTEWRSRQFQSSLVG